MRILAITSNNLFPHSRTDSHGIFFANHLRNLLPLTEKIVVVAPQGWIPSPAWRLRPGLPAGIAFHADYFGIELYRPALLSFAADKRLWLQARLAAAAVAPLCRRLHARHAFDLVVGQGFFGASHAALCVASELGLPCVNWAIGSDINVLPRQSAENLRLLRHDVKHSNLVLTCSQALRREIVRYCPGARNVHTFYWGTDLEGVGRVKRDRAGLRAALGLEASRRYMLCVGVAVPAKGTAEFYEAFRLLAAGLPDLSAVWVGTGPEAPILLDRAGRDGLASRFTITGQLPRGRVLDYLSACDVLAFPSYAEGLPNAVEEAMACGLPVVASAVGGIPEIVADGVTGRLVPAGNAPALAEAVRRVLEDAPAAAGMAARARDLVQRCFNGQSNGPVAFEILRRVAAGGQLEAALPACANVPAGRLPLDVLREGTY